MVPGRIGRNSVSIVNGDITRLTVDAYVVPQFNKGPSYGGVGGAIARAGGADGLAAYGEVVAQRTPAYGEAFLTRSGGGNAAHHIHVASVDSGRSVEFRTVQDAIYHALTLAAQNGLESLAIPALGTGILGDLTSSQSAVAMMSAIDRYARENNPPLSITFAIFGEPDVVDTFARVLATDAYRDSAPQVGGKSFDLLDWEIGAGEAIETRRDLGVRGID